MVAERVGLGVLLFVLVAELWHLRRCRKVAHLAFGPAGKARRWTMAAPLIRACGLGGLAWGLTTLLVMEPEVRSERAPEPTDFRRILLLLDVSPSMQIEDAGARLKQRRCERAEDIVRSVMERILLDQMRFSVVALYSGAQPAVIDTTDPEVVYNILSDLPLEYVFPYGKTELLAGIEEAAELAEPWPEGNATLILVTDGDTVPASGMPSLPKSVADVLVVGVGNPVRGTYIDGHQSRQERRVLRQVARRLGGAYYDGNQRHIPTDVLAALSTPLTEDAEQRLGRREWALAAVAAGSLLFCLLPVALELGGLRRRDS